MSDYIVRNFRKSMFNQDILVNIGSPGSPDISCLNVQILRLQRHDIKVIFQPRSIHGIITEAQFLIPYIQRKLFDDIKLDIYSQVELYSYEESINTFYDGSNNIDVEIISCSPVKREKNDFIETCNIEFHPLSEIPDFMSWELHTNEGKGYPYIINSEQLRNILYAEIENITSKKNITETIRKYGINKSKFFSKLHRKSMYEVDLLLMARIFDIDLNKLINAIDKDNYKE